MSRSIYAITSDKKTSYYQAENFGDLLELLSLLREVHTAKDRIPSIRTSNAERLVLYSKSMLPICPRPYLRLFQPLQPEKYSELLLQFSVQYTSDRQIILDYDSNRFAFSDWQDEGPVTMQGPLDGIVSAYSGALRKKNSTQTYLNKKAFITEMDRICEYGPFVFMAEKSQRRLNEADICFSDEIMQMDNKLNFYMDASFNVDQVFGTNVETSGNDDWLNIYAEYDIARREVCGALEITLNHADGSCDELSYPLDEQEREILLKNMNAYCMEKEGVALEAYCDNIQAESEYPTDQMKQQM